MTEWKTVKLGDVADAITVGFVGQMALEYKENGIPFLRSQNVEPHKLKLDGLKYISEEFHNKIKKSALSPGDVVIVRTGKPGATAVIPSSLKIANCSDLVIVRPGEKIDSRYLSYFINSIGNIHIAAHLVGAVQQHFNVGSARNFEIPHPPLPTQKKIPKLNGDLDDKKELNSRMN